MEGFATRTIWLVHRKVSDGVLRCSIHALLDHALLDHAVLIFVLLPSLSRSLVDPTVWVTLVGTAAVVLHY